ncbi:Predicted oxidoreductase [Amycolatopsis sacchari]|uniref:Predicted oxidoreductase n=1 Tax=Amycolatopsis sacchari TaxID=115433 RepID=A0A1I3M1Z1_9PSEU|nr:Predicted oxidoreductase [Amycolatopsis sacchari]
MSLGSWLTHDQTREGEAIACTRRAHELGVNLFDTANEYQAGRAEEILGKALRPLPRDTYLVATKVYFPMGSSPLQRGLSRKHVMTQVEQSLRRLGVDYIDLYQCHMFDEETPVEETARTMNDLIRAGKILYWGISNWSAEQIKNVVHACDSHNWERPVSNQAQYSALWRKIEREILPTCSDHGMGVLGFSPLAMGVLSGKYQPGAGPPEGTRAQRSLGPLDWRMNHFLADRTLAAVREFGQLAADCGYSSAQLALAWCLRLPEVSSVVIGASRQKQLEDNIQAAGISIGPDLERTIAAILAPFAVTDDSFPDRAPQQVPT